MIIVFKILVNFQKPNRKNGVLERRDFTSLLENLNSNVDLALVVL